MWRVKSWGAIRNMKKEKTTENLKCRICGNMNASKNYQRTSYVDEKENYDVLCPTCQKEMDDYWNGMREEYYSQVL